MPVFRISKSFLLPVLLSIGLIGFLLILRYQTDTRQRASSDSSQELESGLISGNAQAGTDAQASGGKYISFGSTVNLMSFPTNRPLFGTYIPTDKYARYTTLQPLISAYAKIVYPDSLNWCGPGDWSNPQAIIDAPPGRYNISPTFITKIDTVLRNNTLVQKGIYGRGYVQEFGGDRPTTLPADVSSPLFAQALSKVETECTKSIVSAYKDRIRNWRIDNEMFESNGQRRLSWYTNKPRDVKNRITAALQADPSAQIFIDDYGNDEVNDKSTGMLNYFNELRQQGYRINGIGFQGHYSLKYPPNYSSMRANIQRFKDAGFDVAFTEVDVAIDGVSGTTADKLQKQADIFKNTAQICKDYSNCTYYMVFGLDDNESWLGPNALATPFDLAFQPKPAFAGLQQVLGL